MDIVAEIERVSAPELITEGDSPPLTINEMDTVAEIERVSAPELITEGDSSPLMVVTKSDQYFQFNL